jgi:hypothetical protein
VPREITDLLVARGRSRVLSRDRRAANEHATAPAMFYVLELQMLKGVKSCRLAHQCQNSWLQRSHLLDVALECMDLRAKPIVVDQYQGSMMWEQAAAAACENVTDMHCLTPH